MIDLWQEIYGTIRRNKLRTFLTGFAVAWGIFMLIVLLGAGNGLIHAFEQNTSQSALNSIRVFPGWTTKPYDGLQEGRYVQLDNRDVDDTGTLFTEHVLEAGATVSQGGLNISYGGEYVNLSLLGVYPNYREIEAVKTYTGRFINQTDLQERRKVIGRRTVRQGAHGPAGQVCQRGRRGLPSGGHLYRPGQHGAQRGLRALLHPADYI